MRWLIVLMAVLGGGVARAETVRLAVVVGHNAGSGNLPPLRYAESDAGKFARVLLELGDVKPEHLQLLQGRPITELELALKRARELADGLHRSPENRVVLIFYFSGHSDGEGLELGNDVLLFSRLKSILAGVGDLRVTVVDACRSGAGFREKGGTPAQPFVLKLTDTLQSTGDAFISSSGEDEAALESNEVLGSIFTHHFVSGLRGVADTSGDKLVTLGEAYRYAYDRTVSSTAMLPVGAQHPNYDFRLSGQGELVLSSLIKPSSMLVLPDADRALVTDLARDQVVVEVVGGGKEIALSPGQYGVRLFKGGQGYGGRFTLVDGQRQVVAMSALSAVNSSVVVAAKGGPLVVQTMDVPRSKNEIGVGVSVGGTGRILAPAGNNVGPKWQLRADVEPLTTSFASFAGGRLLGSLHLLALGEMSFDPAPVGGGEAPNEAGAQVRVGYRLAVDLWRLQLGLGVELGPGVLAQLYESRSMTVVFTAAPRLSIKVRLAPAIALIASADLTFTGLNYSPVRGAQGVFSWYAFPSINAGLMAYW